MPDTSAPVLVVDDFATMTRIMKGIVNQLGFADVDTCQSGEAALEQLRTRRYGFILCDQEMDPMTGAEFAKRARAHPYNLRCPIIITTASRESAAQCVRDGVHEFVNGFILKPFKPADLHTKLLEIEERARSKKARLEVEPLLSPNKEIVPPFP
jgi:two-component system, chemotaxis family, chemotaxis protein CheY